jgi:hypothetical protein
MAEPTIQLGGGNWAGKTDNLLGYYKKGERFYKQDFTFSRSTTGTYTDKDGYIQEMPYNLLQQSNDFDTTWGTSSVTISSGKSGYNGTNNAWSLNSSSEGYLFQYLTNETSNTLSIYAKAGSVNNIRLRFFGTSNGEGYFNLSNGTKGTTSGLANSSIENVGNGWYRCNISINTTISLVRIYPSVSSSSSSGTNGFVYIQNAQVNSGTSAKTYFPTTTRLNMPRVDYLNNSNGSLLIEPQRTNLETKSNGFSTWSANTNVTRTANYTLSPDGTQNATRLQFTANGSCSNITQSLGSYTISCYAKRNDSGTQDVGFFTNGSGVVNSAWSLTSDWKRFTYTFPALNAGAMGIAGNSGADVSVFGCQLEGLASYATSYIPTSGSTVTRVAETCSQTPASGVIGQTEGTVFFDVNISHIVGNEALGGINSGGYANHATIQRIGNTIQFVRNSATQSGATIVTSSAITVGRYRLALAYKSGDTACFLNGTQVSTTQTQTFTNATLNLIRISGDAIGALPISDTYNQAQLYNTRLSNSELATLTTI